jgi:Tn3 transposase DDE domain
MRAQKSGIFNCITVGVGYSPERLPRLGTVMSSFNTSTPAMTVATINTLMIQQVLSEPDWQGRLTGADRRALTPLLWAHVNPYGTFTLDMSARLPLEQAA